MAPGDLIGSKLSHYRVLELIGRGGMGRVFRAHDEHLDRDVAIKVLPPDTLSDHQSRRRFRREAMVLSRLNHPHINSVYDFDHQDGVDFLVMELVAGETLADRIARGPLSERDALEVALQTAQALEAAHEHGVIHRDLKPGNIMVTSRGGLKVLDFGLAKRISPAIELGGSMATESMVESGTTAGTMPYMAPEQLLNGPVDARTDLWALGIVLYEMVTGIRPFPETQAVALVATILHRPVEFPPPSASRVSPGFRAIILRCLDKDAGRRYGSAGELIRDLRAVAAGGGVRAKIEWPKLRLASLVWATAAVVGLVSLFVLDVGGVRQRLGFPRSPVIRSLAVLPLANLSGDPAQEYLVDGMTEALIVAFTRISGIRVVARGSVVGFKRSQLSLSEIARKLDVDAVLQGSVGRTGERVLVTVELVRAATGENLWGERYDRTVGDLLQFLDEVAVAVANRTRVALTTQERRRLARAQEIRPEALEAYLRGRFYWNEFTSAGFRKAVDQFNRAIEIQPNYAAAYAGLADAYGGLSTLALDPKVAMPRVRAAADRALSLDPELADAYASRAYVKAFFDWNWPEAEQDFLAAIDRAPGNAQARLNYGYMLVVLGRFDDATEQLARAHELDPLSSFISCVQLWPLYEGRRFDEAIRAARQVIAVDSTAWNAHQVMGQALFAKGDLEGAYAAELRGTVILGRDTTLAFGTLYALMGRHDIVRRKLEKIVRRKLEKVEQFDGYTVGKLYALIGDTDRAFEYFERELEMRRESVIFLKVDPDLDSIRDDPRYLQLLRRMNLDG